MAFIQTRDGKGLVRDSFPPELSRNNNETESFEDMDDTTIKPLKFERLFDWALVTSVVPTHDKTRTMQCVHKPASHLLPTTNSLTKVGIRLFGFLGKHNFTAIGNWDRYELTFGFPILEPGPLIHFLSDICTHGNLFVAHLRTVKGVPKAITYFTLEPGQYPEQHNQQKRQLEDLRKMAYKYLGQGLSDRSDTARELYFQRRVFQKTTGVHHWQPLETEEILDPDVASLITKWRLDRLVSFGRRTSSGALRSCSPLIFSSGDFVDVTATLDIATFTKNKYTKNKIHFSFSRIVQLCSAENIASLTAQPSQIEGPTREICIQDAVLTIDDDVDDSEVDE